MTKQNTPRTAQKDSRAWVDTLRGIGPLLYITQERTVGDSLGEMSSIVSIDTSRTVLAVGARASRGLGIFAGLMCLFPLWLVASSAYSGFASGEKDEFFYNTLFLFTILACFAAIFFSFDIRRVAETLVLLDRRSGQIIAASPDVKARRAKDISFVSWSWKDCDFAIERVIMSATGAQAFHLRAVQRNPHGEYERSVLLMAMIPTIEQAESIFEFLRRYMAHEDSALSNTIKLVPGGKLNFFEACKHSFITYLIDVGDDGLPRWPWPLIALFYGLLAAGLAVAFPFVIGKVIAEWSSQEMQFPPEQKSETAAPIPGITLIPAQQAIFAPWEKAYYLACMLAGAGLWTWGIWHYFLSSN